MFGCRSMMISAVALMPGRRRSSRFFRVARAGKVFSGVEPPLKIRAAIGLT